MASGGQEPSPNDNKVIIPGTRRADGSMRKDRVVKSGFASFEQTEKYVVPPKRTDEHEKPQMEPKTEKYIVGKEEVEIEKKEVKEGLPSLDFFIYSIKPKSVPALANANKPTENGAGGGPAPPKSTVEPKNDRDVESITRKIHKVNISERSLSSPFFRNFFPQDAEEKYPVEYEECKNDFETVIALIESGTLDNADSVRLYNYCVSKHAPFMRRASGVAE